MFHWNWLWILAIAALFSLLTANIIVYRRRAKARARDADLPAPIPLTNLDQLIPDSRFLTIDGANLHYVQAGEPGEGGDVVLLHGIGASVYIWRFLFPILQTRHRVTAFDFFGFGKSSKAAHLRFDLDAQAESIARALSELGIEKAKLVGSSMGGAIALWMAKRWPERFTHVVGLGPATDAKSVPAVGLGMAKHFAVTAPLFRSTVNRHSIKLILNYVVTNKGLITDEVVQRYLEPFRDRGESLRAFVAATSVLSDRRLPDELKNIPTSVQTLLIWGANDYLVSRKSIKKLSRVMSETSFLEHATGGHHIMEDEPVWLARQLELFFAGRETAPSV